MSSSSLPIGWENRSNTMSEKDMKLGGIAATKFRNQNVIPSIKGAYSDETTAGIYQTSDAVRENYYKQIDVIRNHHTQTNDDNNSINDENNTASSTKSVVETTFSNSRENPSTLETKLKEKTPTTTTPAFWEERQKTRQLEAEGVYRNKDDKDNETTNNIKNQYVTRLATGTPATIVRASTSTSTATSSCNAQLALLRLATHTLETVADTFEQDTGNNDTANVLSLEDRTAFAAAMQRALVALAEKK